MQVTGLVPMLGVADVERSLGFYRDTLGFTKVGDNYCNDRLTWVSMRRGRAEVMLTGPISAVQRPEAREFLGHVMLYIYVDGCASLREQWTKNGVQCSDLRETFYGMLEFECCDPDGYTIIVGQELGNVGDDSPHGDAS